MKSKRLPCVYVTQSSYVSVLIIAAFSDVTSPLYCVKKGGSNLAGFLLDERVHPIAVSDYSCTYTWYRAAVAGGQQDIPPDHECWCFLLCVFVHVCVGGWRAHSRGVAEHLLGSSPANQTSDVRWQWKIPSQPVWQRGPDWHADAFECWTNRCWLCDYNTLNRDLSHNSRESQTITTDLFVPQHHSVLCIGLNIAVNMLEFTKRLVFICRPWPDVTINSLKVKEQNSTMLL